MRHGLDGYMEHLQFFVREKKKKKNLLFKNNKEFTSKMKFNCTYCAPLVLVLPMSSTCWTEHTSAKFKLRTNLTVHTFLLCPLWTMSHHRQTPALEQLNNPPWPSALVQISGGQEMESANPKLFFLPSHLQI